MKYIYSSIFILFLSVSFSNLNAQSIYNKGKISGDASSTTIITAMDIDGFDYHVIAGTFMDSVDVDQTASKFMLYGGNSSSGVINSFLSYYDYTGTLQFAKKLGNSTDSVRINSVSIDNFGNFVAVGTFSGTVDFADNAGNPINRTATGTQDGFIAYYDNSGGVIAVVVLESTGFAFPTDVDLDDNGNINVIGYFTNDIDMDPSGSVANFTATSKDGFIGQYDGTLNYIDSRNFPGPGDQVPTDLKMWGNETVLGGYFNTSLDFDLSAGINPATNNGGNDAFLAWYDNTYTELAHLNLGGIGDDYLDDFQASSFGGFLILMDFEQTVDFDPSGNTVDLISEGGSDVAIARYDLNMNFGFARSLGNSGDNHGFTLTKNEMGGGRQSLSEDDIMLTLNFSGLMDFDPDQGGTQLESSDNSAINSAIVNLDSTGNYLFHGRIESSDIIAMRTTGFTGNDVIMAGNFTGTNIDLSPYFDTSFVNFSGPNAVFYLFYNRCHIRHLPPQIVEPYECTGDNAKLSVQILDGAVYPLSYNWSNGDYYSFEEIATGVSAETSGYYNVYVSDHYGCQFGDTIWVRNHAPGLELDATLNLVATTCGDNLGSASLTPINALGNVSYSWSTGSILPTADSLEANSYFVQVTDDSVFCYVEKYFTIENSNGPVITIDNANDATCGNVNNGSINITVTGGAAPYTFIWSNGATTEDLIGVGGGTYSVLVTDASGCETSTCISLLQPTAINAYESSFYSDCNLSTGSLLLETSGGSSPYTFLWDANTGFATNDSIYNLSAGIYNVTITDSLGCTANFNFGVSDAPWNFPYPPYVSSNFIDNPNCLGTPGYIDIYSYAYSPLQIMTYLWDSGETTSNLSDATNGIHYLSVTDETGCESVTSYYVFQQFPNAPAICMVTIDSTATQNVVVWDKSTTQEAAYYNIYREGYCNQNDFGIVGRVDFDSLSVFYDTVVNSNTRTWRYYVTAVDTCGFESDGSEIHRTIHLSSYVDADTNIALDWTEYIGMEILGYKIYRRQPTGNIFDYVDSVSALTTNYLDTIDFDPYPEVVYFVDAIPATVCNATRAYNQNEARSNHSRNIAPKDTSTLTVPEISEETSIEMYPNPTNDMVNLKVKSDSKNWTLQMMDQTGRIIVNGRLNNQTAFSTKEIASGVYFIRLTSDTNEIHTLKLMIVH